MTHYSDDMARRRLQQKGNLYQQGGWWKLRWREDQLDTEGTLKRGWSKPAWIGPSEGPGKLTKREAQRLAWENFLVRQQWRLGEYTSLKETARARTLPIAAPLAQAFAGMKARGQYAGPDDPVFCSRNGTPVDEHNIANRHLKPTGVKLGMPWLSWHCFRRTTATVADQLGAGTSDRKGILGHSTDAMSKHYVQPADHDRRRVFLEQIAAAIMPGNVGVASTGAVPVAGN